LFAIRICVRIFWQNGLMRVSDVSEMSDEQLLTHQRALAMERRRIDADSAIVAAEIAHRSRRELGYDGLAQRRGVRTPELLVQRVTGLSGADARALVRAGALVRESSSESTEATRPWLRAVALAVAEGRLGVSAANVIEAGLGIPREAVAASSLTEAADSLVRDAASLTLEQLASAARDLRAAIDASGIAEREEQQRERRYLVLTPQLDGMTRISGLLDPESAAVIVAAVDAVTAPRSSGPRFVDPERAAESDDMRTPQQLAADALVEMVRVATLADDGRIFGSRRVGVRLHVAERDLRRAAGAARIEGQADPVSIATAERHLCESGMIPVLFDGDGQVVNVGRDQRLFTERQRIALAARDGGCLASGCDRPPSWCEAHHINEWLRDEGKTDVADGVLLCRHHHLLVHNNGWRVRRDGARYWMEGPHSRERIAMPSKNRLLERVLA
jgi:hypothetical protein